MTLIVTSPIAGTYLVRSEPIPFGKTEVSSVAVWRYRYGWACERCGSADNTSRKECEHIKAAKAKEHNG